MAHYQLVAKTIHFSDLIKHRAKPFCFTSQFTACATQMESVLLLSIVSAVLAGHLDSSRICSAKLDFTSSHTTCSNCAVHLFWHAPALDSVALEAPGKQSG